MSVRKLAKSALETMYRPAISCVKRRLANNYHPWVESFLYNLGKCCHRTKATINHRLNPKSSPARVKEMERPKMVEYGALIFFEYICTTGVLLFWSLYGIRKGVLASRAEKEKARQFENHVLSIQEDIFKMKLDLEQMGKRLGKAREAREDCCKKTKESIAEIAAKVDDIDSVRCDPEAAPKIPPSSYPFL